MAKDLMVVAKEDDEEIIKWTQELFLLFYQKTSSNGLTRTIDDTK